MKLSSIEGVFLSTLPQKLYVVKTFGSILHFFLCDLLFLSFFLSLFLLLFFFFFAELGYAEISQADKDILLNRHNFYRAEIAEEEGVADMQKMEWDDEVVKKHTHGHTHTLIHT